MTLGYHKATSHLTISVDNDRRLLLRKSAFTRRTFAERKATIKQLHLWKTQVAFIATNLTLSFRQPCCTSLRVNSIVIGLQFSANQTG